MTPAAIVGIGTAVPAATFGQEVAIPLAMARCCSNESERAWLQRIYRGCGVRRRGSVLLAHDDDAASIESFYPPRLSEHDGGPTTAVRLALYMREAGKPMPSFIRRASRTWSSCRAPDRFRRASMPS